MEQVCVPLWAWPTATVVADEGEEDTYAALATQFYESRDDDKSTTSVRILLP